MAQLLLAVQCNKMLRVQARKILVDLQENAVVALQSACWLLGSRNWLSCCPLETDLFHWLGCHQAYVALCAVMWLEAQIQRSASPPAHLLYPLPSSLPDCLSVISVPPSVLLHVGEPLECQFVRTVFMHTRCIPGPISARQQCNVMCCKILLTHQD